MTGFVLRTLFRKKGIQYNPPLHASIAPPQYHTFIFDNLPHSTRYFQELRGYSESIREALNQMIVPGILKKIRQQPAPEIGVHVRRGDFVKGSFVESIDFFKNAILYLRANYNEDLKALVFSDGYVHELQELLDLPSTSLYIGQTDIEDLMVLSRSSFIITSLTSTFSYWAVFLSEAVAVYNPLYEGGPIRWDHLTLTSGLLIESAKLNSENLYV